MDVERIDAFVREQVQRHGIPGLAIALVDGKQVIFASGYGYADRTGRAITAQTPFVLASVSKPITALAVMQLVEQGKVALDTPVLHYLPTFRVADPVASQQITVRHLLNHTSGIPEMGCQNSRFGAHSLEQFVAALATIPLAAPPGQHHFYCSGNYNILGRIIEVVSHQSYASYIEQQVFAPLQMHHSFTLEQAAQADGLVTGHSWLFGQLVEREYPYDVPQQPSGFLIASAEDMAHFVIAQLNEGQFGDTSVLSPQGIAAMQAPGVPLGAEGATYALGWRTGTIGGVPAVFHAGDHPDIHTLVLMEPQTKRGAVVLFTANAIPALLTAFRDIETGVARLLDGQEPAPPRIRLPHLYALIDIVLGGLLVLACWPLLRLQRWKARLEQQMPLGRWQRVRMIVPIGWDYAVALMVLVGGYGLSALLFDTQSWGEVFLLVPDLATWMWTIGLMMVLTATLRLVLLCQVHCKVIGKQQITPVVVSQ